MKLAKITTVFLLLTLGAELARAEVVVYRLRQTGKLIGGEAEVSLRGTGYIIVDPDSQQGYNLVAGKFQGTKFFITSTFTNTRTYTVKGSRGKTYTVFASSFLSAGRDRNQLSRGLNASITLTPTRTISFPKRIKGSGGTIFGEPGGEAALLEGAATATFSARDSSAANTAGETLEQTYERLRQMLISQGYEEFSQ